MEYKFKEDEYLIESQEYIDTTYEEHYAQNKYQATDVIIDAGHGLGFCMGNIFKYAKRYGLKSGYSRSDLLKILHYTTIALYVHDREIGNVD